MTHYSWAVPNLIDLLQINTCCLRKLGKVIEFALPFIGLLLNEFVCILHIFLGLGKCILGS